MANLFQSVRGFNDVLPTDTAVWQYLHNTAAEVFSAYGYGEIKMPVLEHTELFKRSIGEATDAAMVSGLAPGNVAVIWIVGKSTAGSAATGRSR